MPRKHRLANLSKSAPDSLQHHKRSGKRNRSLIAVWIGAGIVIVLAAVLLFLKPTQSGPTEISAAQAYEKYNAGALVVDVRSLAEWNQGHIANSVLIPLDELPTRLNELPKDRDIVVVCHTGVRSKEGSAILFGAGFTHVSCMTGGLQAWVEAGYPIQQ
jgi:rhodanese-related sulfurtransferase